MNEHIIIRPAVSSDLPTLLVFEQGVIQAERPFDDTLKPDPISYYDIAAMIDADDVELVVAEVEGRVIGSGYLRIVDSKPYLRHARHGYLGFMFVEPDYRGKGINQLIIKALLDWGCAKDIHEFRLDVYVQNTAAVRAYEKVGFMPNLLDMRMEVPTFAP
jgi:RimJ/RimL family protein N-acetyltransferase